MTSLVPVQHVQPGEAVSAGITSRSTRQLEQNLNRLGSQVDLMIEGEALVLRGATLHSSTVVGTPVYWEAGQLRFSPGLPNVTYDATTGVFATAATARIHGVVYQKESSTKGDVLVYGRAPVDISAVTVTAAGTGAGLYYLAAGLAGRLTQARPPLAITVLEKLDDDTVFVNPQLKGWFDEHAHSVVSLVCRPAGDHTPPGGSGTHTITGADATLEGWLPASHASFGGTAPANAKFGYNLAQDDNLQAIWPPTPIDAVSIVWDKGLNRVGGTEIPLGGSGGLIIVDANGIWWMSDCNADVPWPNETFVDGVSTATPSGDACPRPETMRLRLYSTRVTLATDQSLVTSLRTVEGGPLRITNCKGDPAIRGDLVLEADLSLLEADEDDEEGYIAHKGIGDDGKILRGPVVSGIRVTGNGVTATGSAVIPADPETDTPATYLGIVTIDLDPDPSAKEMRPTTIALNQVRQRTDDRGTFLSFEKEIRADLTLMFHVPATGFAEDTAVRLRLTLVGTAAGTLPALAITYRKAARGTTTPASLPSSGTSLSLGTMPTLASANQYVELDTGTFTVDPGDHITLKVQRAQDDAYTGEVQVLDVLLV